jgi:hypothetical protein
MDASEHLEPSMTPAQIQVFQEINEQLREHFSGSLLIVDDGNDSGFISTMQYNGGLLRAIGMARAAERKMIQNQMEAIAFRSGDMSEPPEEEI